jgi:hypothetical protein
LSLADLHAGEWFEVQFRLDQPPPVSITIQLESSDARAVEVPREIIFQRGEREKMLRVQAGRDVSQLTTVMLRARLGRDQPVERQVRVRPRPRGTSGGSR